MLQARAATPVQAPREDTPDQGTPILTFSGADSAADERFIAVTKQEEQLLAAMRAKRAMMMKEGLHVTAATHVTSAVEPVAKKEASKKQSLSSIKTVTANTLQPASVKVSAPWHERKASKHASTIMKFPEPPSMRSRSAMSCRHEEETLDADKHEQVLMFLDKSMSTMNPYDMAEPSPDLSDFILDFDASGFPSPPRRTKSKGAGSGSHLRGSTLASPKRQQHYRESSFGRPRPDSEFMPMFVPGWPEPAPPLPSHELLEADAGSSSVGQNSMEAEDDDHHQHNHSEEEEVEQQQEQVHDTAPSSPVAHGSPTSIYEDDEEPQPRNKAVRISAVGQRLPEFGQWGDDG